MAPVTLFPLDDAQWRSGRGFCVKKRMLRLPRFTTPAKLRHVIHILCAQLLEAYEVTVGQGGCWFFFFNILIIFYFIYFCISYELTQFSSCIWESYWYLMKQCCFLLGVTAERWGRKWGQKEEELQNLFAHCLFHSSSSCKVVVKWANCSCCELLLPGYIFIIL